MGNLFRSIHGAAKEGNCKNVCYFLDKGVSPNERSKTLNRSPLHFAANVEVANLLLDRGADLNARAYGGQTPLCDACYDGRLEVVRFLLERGAEPNELNDEITESPLERAVRGYDGPFGTISSNHLEVIRLLLDNGVDPNDASKNFHKFSPLMLASRWGRLDVVQLMVDKGGDPLLRDCHNFNSIDHAARCYAGGCQYQIEVVKYLFEVTQRKPGDILMWAVMMLKDLYIYHHIDAQSMIDVYQMMGGEQYIST